MAVTAWGLTGVMIKSIEMDAIAIACLAVRAVRRPAWRSGTGHVAARVRFGGDAAHDAAGALLSADVILFFTAVKLTAVVNATTIGALQPLVVAGFAARCFGERVTGREIVAAVIAIDGRRSDRDPVGRDAGMERLGRPAAVGALFAWSAYFVVAKRRGTRVSPVEFTIGTSLWAAIVALPVGLVVGQDMGPPASSEWLPLLGLLTAGGVFGHMLMNWALPRVPLWLSSTLTLLIPVVSSLAAWLWLDEPLTAWQLAAMGVVVASLAIIVTTQTPAPSTRLDELTPTP